MGTILSSRKHLLPALLLLALPLAFASAETPPAKTWVDKLHISGDLRYRHELTSEEVGTSAVKVRVPDRNRQRLRLRLGIQAQVNDDLDVITRFGTSTPTNGIGDPISTNQDLGGGFVEKPFWLDRAYLDYHPLKQITARAGKFGVPFDGTELLWDADLNLEGIAALPSVTLGKTDVYAGVGGFWAAERKSADGPDQGLFVYQMGTTPSFGKFSTLLAASYIDYGNVKNAPTLFNTAKGAGNTVHTAGGVSYYNNDFNMIDVTGQVTFKAERAEATVLGDFVQNTGTKTDTANTGWLAGVTLKFKHMPLDWELAYNYRVLQADATIGAFADSDPAGGGTNYKGHKISASATVLHGTRLGICYIRDTKDPDHAKLNYNRLLVDIEAKF